MKLLFLVPNISTSGGVEKVVSLLTAHLTNVHQHQITILNCEPFNGNNFYELNSKVDMQSLNMLTYPVGFIKRMFWYKRLSKSLSSYLKENSFDIVFAQGAYVAMSLSLIRTNSIKVGCIHVSYNAIHFFPRFLSRFLFKKLFALVVLTAHDKTYYDKFLKKVYIIPNFIAELPIEYSQQNEQIIVAAGRLEQQKGFDLLISAFSKVHVQHPQWKLIIYGEGGKRKVLEKQIKEEQLHHVVTLPGETTELNNHLRSGAIFVLSSRYEGFPLILLEAMSLGLCCISFDIDVALTLLKNGNGFLVNQGDVHDLAETICKSISNIEQRKEMGKGVRKIAKQYELSIVGNQWQTLIKRVKEA